VVDASVEGEKVDDDPVDPLHAEARRTTPVTATRHGEYQGGPSPPDRVSVLTRHPHPRRPGPYTPGPRPCRGSSPLSLTSPIQSLPMASGDIAAIRGILCLGPCQIMTKTIPDRDGQEDRVLPNHDQRTPTRKIRKSRGVRPPRIPTADRPISAGRQRWGGWPGDAADRHSGRSRCRRWPWAACRVESRR
jgi:hypothetical protein